MRKARHIKMGKDGQSVFFLLYLVKETPQRMSLFSLTTLLMSVNYYPLPLMTQISVILVIFPNTNP